MLSTAAGNAALVRADPLQRMHTLHNLAELLSAQGGPPPGVARTLRDDKLADEAAAIGQVRLVTRPATGCGVLGCPSCLMFPPCVVSLQA